MYTCLNWPWENMRASREKRENRWAYIHTDHKSCFLAWEHLLLKFQTMSKIRTWWLRRVLSTWCSFFQGLVLWTLKTVFIILWCSIEATVPIIYRVYNTIEGKNRDFISKMQVELLPSVVVSLQKWGLWLVLQSTNLGFRSCTGRPYLETWNARTTSW